jgi:hypothetical protein
MEITTFGTYEYEVSFKTFYGANVTSVELPQYFIPRNYGNGVKSIFYYEYCDADAPGPGVSLLQYQPRKKHIRAMVLLDLKTAQSLTERQLYKYTLQKYLETTLDFEDLHIKDFDLQTYLKDLEHFFEVTVPLERS